MSFRLNLNVERKTAQPFRRRMDDIVGLRLWRQRSFSACKWPSIAKVANDQANQATMEVRRAMWQSSVWSQICVGVFILFAVQFVRMVEMLRNFGVSFDLWGIHSSSTHLPFQSCTLSRHVSNLVQDDVIFDLLVLHPYHLSQDGLLFTLLDKVYFSP